MILTAKKIHEKVKRGEIIISPYNEKYLNPNSYNFHLSDELFVYKNKILDPKVEQPIKKIKISKKGLILRPNELYLGCTEEKMGGNYFAPFIFGRSSTARLGLFVQITAPLGDIGFVGKWTLQLNPIRPIKVYPHMRIGQIFFLKPLGEITLYEGKYQFSNKPRKSEIYKDFE